MKQKSKPECSHCGFKGKQCVNVPAIRTFAVGGSGNSPEFNPAFQNLKNQYEEERKQPLLSLCPKCGCLL